MEKAIILRHLAYKFVKLLMKNIKKKLKNKNEVKKVSRKPVRKPKQGKVHYDHTYALPKHSLSRPKPLISSPGYVSNEQKSSDDRVPKLIIRPQMFVKDNRANKVSDKVTKPWKEHPLSMGFNYRFVRAAFYRDSKKEKVRVTTGNIKNQQYI